MTEYRIVPYTSGLTGLKSMYLQFKAIKKGWFGKEKEVWKYVPDKTSAYVKGWWLTIKDCPTGMSFLSDSDFLHAFHGQESYRLIPFTKKYPDIEVYFQEIRGKRRGYLEEETKNAKIINL